MFVALDELETAIPAQLEALRKDPVSYTHLMDTFEKIRALLAEQLDIDPAKITMDSDIMGDFEADSLDIVDMVMTVSYTHLCR